MKYAPLKEHLLAAANSLEDVTLTFRQIEAIIGSPLPKSATDYQQWWGNQTNLKNRPHAAAWLSAGFLVDSVQPKQPGGWVRFRRK